ncbi:MAG: TIGR02584 family CRISPR-associated protein [Candidatus Marinimicrobia bacterium]|nr:TIGR02584 family CRISPR-associated protein [Candidatus Neomarinimicrobiota bacterium]
MKHQSNEKYVEIFIAVLGKTPQVLTECLYYYYSHYYKQNRYFDSIFVYTTTEGKEKLVKSLFLENKLKELIKTLKINPEDIPFKKDSILLYERPDGSYLSDLRTTEDNEHAQSFLFNHIKTITMDPEVRVTATVAGGRKTMSSQMALAFQLYGRKQDELIHILAPEEKMKPSSNWYFPKNPSRENEQLYVSHIPVLRVGRYITRSLDISPDLLLNKLQKELVSRYKLLRLTIKKNMFIGMVNEKEDSFELPPLLASYLRYLLRRRKKSKCSDECTGCALCFVSTQGMVDNKEAVLTEHALISGKYDGNLQRTTESDTDTNNVSESISRIKKAIRENNISLSFKERIQIKKRPLEPGNKKFMYYGLLIDKKIIQFKD